ncbi:glycosyltransferase family 2 protein [Enterococcus faecium]|uniref:glycosyltransferase family 2 protein n=1 Tax=Enterococcus faecium TaxID=1352 RepID=UPI0022064D1D|nr:glycosyltransferase family 2 protein [Enterococcus faecium]BDP46005.1 hypothetical protein EfmJHP9_08750 [Enterococcus faecium]
MCLSGCDVPVYNVEKYLKKCVDSILGQTFTDFESLLIDDGSTDNSGSICDELAKTDNRIKVIHKENGGLSDARNIGIEVAKGDFIGFIDSDDYIDEDMYAFLYNNILKYDAELSMCGIYDVHKNKEIKKLTPFSQLVTKSEAIELVLDGKLVVANAVSKLYKKELFENVRYPKGKIAEDAAVILKIINQCNKIPILIVLNYSVQVYRNTSFVFIESFGLYWSQRKKPIIEAGVNLLLSLLLLIVFDMGINGVLIGTIGSSLGFVIWYEAFIIYKTVFEKRFIHFF